MLVPSIFGDNLIDNFMRDFDRDFFTDKVPAAARGFAQLKTDILEKDNCYELAMDLPGYKKEDVSIRLEQGYLTITAQKEENNEVKEEGKYLRRERYTGKCARTFYVGKNVTQEDVKAKFTDGVLTVTVAKEDPNKVIEEKHIMIED